jgi:hypothetical protein
MKIDISKSSRHSKITGDAAERFILYWLSKNGFECALIDHIGIDIIARNPHTNEVMGISVKSRSRNEGTEGTHVNIPYDNIDKVDKACTAFNCVPYFAIMVDEESKIHIFILSKDKLLRMFPRGERVIAWKMTKKHVYSYKADDEIKIIELNYDVINWWKKKKSRG